MINKPKLLFLDDNPVSLDSIVRLLKAKNKYDLFSATSIKEALKVLDEENIDVFIVDYLLEGEPVKGDEIIESIRADEKRNNYNSFLPCILITASKNKQHFEQKMRKYEFEFHTKLQDKAGLINKIEEGIRAKKLRNVSDTRNNKKDTMQQEQSKPYVDQTKEGSFFMTTVFKKFILPIIILLIAGVLLYHYTDFFKSSNKYEVSIRVLSQDSKPITDAEIYVSGMAKTLKTDSSGFVKIELKSNAADLIIVKDGYETLRKTIDSSENNYTLNLQNK